MPSSSLCQPPESSTKSWHPIPPGTSGVLFLAPAFTQTPLFSHPFFKPNKIADTASSLIRKIDTSIAVNLEKCLSFVHVLASQNPFLKKISSITSEFNAFRQISGRGGYNKLSSLSNHNFAAVLPGDSVAGIVITNGILNFLNIYNTVLVVRLVLTWFPNAPPAIVSPLSTLCDPYLNIFRGIIPPLGGTLDLSPILAFLVLNAFTSAAAALPAELPSEGTGLFHGTSESQKKWITRLNRGSNSSNSK